MELWDYCPQSPEVHPKLNKIRKSLLRIDLDNIPVPYCTFEKSKQNLAVKDTNYLSLFYNRRAKLIVSFSRNDHP